MLGIKIKYPYDRRVILMNNYFRLCYCSSKLFSLLKFSESTFFHARNCINLPPWLADRQCPQILRVTGRGWTESPKYVHRSCLVYKTRTTLRIVGTQQPVTGQLPTRRGSWKCTGPDVDRTGSPRISVMRFINKYIRYSLEIMVSSKPTMRSSSLMRSEFLLTNLNADATKGTSSLVRIEHFSANFVLEFPMVAVCLLLLQRSFLN